MKINHQELVDGFCKYFEQIKKQRQKKYGFEDKYLESIKMQIEQKQIAKKQIEKSKNGKVKINLVKNEIL